MNERDPDPFNPPQHVVRPRGRQYKLMPVMAIHGKVTMTEDGTLGSMEELIAALPGMPSTLFVKIGAADFLGACDMTFSKDYTAWQWHATERERAICRPDGVRIAARVSIAIHFFGFKHGNYHKIIDPITMHGRGLDEIWPGTDGTIVRLRDWAVALRDFCHENNLDVRPTTGGISAQFLTDPRFYPDARRKVPRPTNDSVRERLPGNFYHLTVAPGPQREYTAYYLDQHRAHHRHAMDTDLPCANGLYAMGDFAAMDTISFPDVWDNFYGLYCLDLRTPTRRRNKFMREWLNHSPLTEVIERRFIYSNELPLLQDMGYEVIGVRAAWGSHRRDTGIATYAAWAMAQLDRYSDAPWIKPLLLSTYGTLATRPKIAEAIFKTAKKGDHVTVATGQNKLRGRHIKGRVKLEPRIANVLHRGMIEAGTRVESLYYAIHLSHTGYHVLSIYADAVIIKIDDDKPEQPLIVDPWRLKATLNHLQFINTQAFQSGEMTRMPGVTGISRDAAKHRQRTNKAPNMVPRTEALTGRTIYRPIGSQ